MTANAGQKPTALADRGSLPMHLIHILLPLNDNTGKPLPKRLFRAVAAELTEKFDGLTAHTRAPAEGVWKETSDRARRDEIVIYEVMVEVLDEPWWTKYRKSLEDRFEQEKIIVRAHEMRLL